MMISASLASLRRGMMVFERDMDVKKGLNSRDLIKFDVVRTKEVSLSSLQTQSAFFPGKSY
jgi:hypothetical protein